MTTLSALPASDLPMLQRTQALGFDKLSYTVDLLDGEIDRPLEMVGAGLSLDYMRRFLPKLGEDPLRRKIARGEVPVKNAPIVFENLGSEIRVEGHDAIQAADCSLLVWCLEQGVRTGVTFRVRLDRGRCASLNFYSAFSYSAQALEARLPIIFLTGHLVHAHLESRHAPSTEALLSRREAECLEAMARGESNGEIARQLGLSANTVKEYAQSLYRKFQVRTRAQAVARGYELSYLN